MAKTIKFNLICDEKPIRTIEDLQENFSVEDVIKYYDNGLLERWLDVRGYKKELEQVKQISEDKEEKIARELIKIFEISLEDAVIDEGLQMMFYQNEREEKYELYKEEEYKVEEVVSGYFQRYEEKIQKMLDNPLDAAIIKATITEMIDHYWEILKKDWRSLFFELYDSKSYLAIMCLLMHEPLRCFYLPIEITDIENDDIEYDTDYASDKKYVYGLIKDMIKRDKFKENLKEHLHSFSGETDGYWKDLEKKGKKYMIISMGQGDYVRSAGVTGGDLSADDIENEFVILDGIDYKSHSKIRELVYMEV